MPDFPANGQSLIANRPSPYAWVSKSLNTLKRADWYRQVPSIEGSQDGWITVDGQPLLNFASNDYLGLASDPRLAAAAIEAIETYGTGSTGSRLLSGQRPLHQTLERAIATLKGTDDAIVFSSGYLANLGTLTALVGPRDLILADQYNHSSLKRGAVLTGATVMDYGHCESDAIAAVLQTHRSRFRRCLIVTDSVFSMDGDLCPLPQILTLAEAFEAMVMIDEAHGTGVLGDTGAGVVEYLGCRGRPLIQMGTLSKALGSLGGYVTGPKDIIDFLRNRAPSWIYTTGLSPADTAAATVAIATLQSDPERRQHLAQNASYLRKQLDQLLLDLPHLSYLKRFPSDSPIVCLQVKDAAMVLSLGQQLKRAGFFVSAVRPPTVPTSRLRMTTMATHESPQIDQLINQLGQILRS